MPLDDIPLNIRWQPARINISILGAALDVTNRHDIPERFDLVFKADGAQIPCRVVWRRDDQIGVAFD